MISKFKLNGEYTVLNSVNVSGYKIDELTEQLMSLTNEDGVSTIALVGIPAAISCRRNKTIKKMYSDFNIRVIDGMPIVKKLRALGEPNQRCSAPDFMPSVFSKGIKDNKTHFFYGGKNQETLDKMILNIKQSFPGIRIVGSFCPPFRDLSNDEKLQIINQLKILNPDFVWVGIGAPKQEKWISENAVILNHGVFIGVGASFDFFAKTLKKAPQWIEKFSLEWLYRLFREPKRLFKRYVFGGFFYLWYSLIDLLDFTTHKNNKKTKKEIALRFANEQKN